MTVELETPRLILQPLSAKHADDLFPVFSDEKPCATGIIRPIANHMKLP